MIKAIKRVYYGLTVLMAAAMLWVGGHIVALFLDWGRQDSNNG